MRARGDGEAADRGDDARVGQCGRGSNDGVGDVVIDGLHDPSDISKQVPFPEEYIRV